jgi:hypothetical protein
LENLLIFTKGPSYDFSKILKKIFSSKISIFSQKNAIFSSKICQKWLFLPKNAIFWQKMQIYFCPKMQKNFGQLAVKVIPLYEKLGFQFFYRSLNWVSG